MESRKSQYGSPMAESRLSTAGTQQTQLEYINNYKTMKLAAALIQRRQRRRSLDTAKMGTPELIEGYAPLVDDEFLSSAADDHVPFSVIIEGQRIRVLLHYSGQHIIEWLDSLPLPAPYAGEALPPGHCNLYQYPISMLAGSGREAELEGERLFALDRLLQALASDQTSPLHSRTDNAGAYPLHGLLVGNRQASLTISLQLIRARPQMLLAAHEAPGPFQGENSLHIVIVNGHEALLIELMRIACRSLSRDELRRIFTARAEGPFFEDLPMRHYGSTPVGYAAVFGMKSALQLMLMLPELNGIVDLNSPEVGCPITGFLPIHAVTANGLRDMLHFLVELPPADRPLEGAHGEVLSISNEEWLAKRAQIKSLTRVGIRDELCGITPMQLAVKLGDHNMFKFIMRQQTRVLWHWGPVTQYIIDLDQIDSSGLDSSDDVMECVGSIFAEPATHALLLDEVLNGFVWELFIIKWTKYASKVHGWLILIDLCFLVPLATTAAFLKQAPEKLLFASGEAAASWVPWLPVALIATASLTLLPELAFTALYIRHQLPNNNQAPDHRPSLHLGALLANTGAWLMAFHIHLKSLSIGAAVGASVLLLNRQQVAALTSMGGNGNEGSGGDDVWMVSLRDGSIVHGADEEAALVMLGLVRRFELEPFTTCPQLVHSSTRPLSLSSDLPAARALCRSPSHPPDGAYTPGHRRSSG